MLDWFTNVIRQTQDGANEINIKQISRLLEYGKGLFSVVLHKENTVPNMRKQYITTKENV